MSDKIEETNQESYETLQRRLLQAEGQIQALAHTVMLLMAELEVRHGLNPETVEKCMKDKRWKGVALEPFAVGMLQEMVRRMSEARKRRLQQMLDERYGLDVDLSGQN